jgi:predicted N-acetyltransferase YhbS
MTPLDFTLAPPIVSVEAPTSPNPPNRKRTSEVEIRPGRIEDAELLGQICFAAFGGIARAHSFAPDFPSRAVAADLMRAFLGNSGFQSVVAEHQGIVVGSNFVDCRGSIAGIGPISVDPVVQDRSIGRKLMLAAIRLAEAAGADGARLVQSAYHLRSLSLYAKLGFQARETLACMQGKTPGTAEADVAGEGLVVRPATIFDIEACDALCHEVHLFDRGGELRDAIAQGTATVVERHGRITGYATAIGFMGHAVGRGNRDLQALIAAAPAITGPGILVPMRNTGLFRWCLEQGLKVVQPMTLMSTGTYEEPAGAFLPSVLY